MPDLTPDALSPSARVNRRQLLLRAVSASLAGFALPVRAQDGHGDAFASLEAVLDTLLPADAVSPAASDLGIASELHALMAQNEMMRRLFAAALGWLDGLADRPFRDLEPEQRVAILQALEQADYNQIPGRFFHILRAVAVEFYYARPEAIAGFPLSEAPQPEGYPPPWS